MLLLIVYLHHRELIDIYGRHVILAGLCLVALGLLVGWTLGGPGTDKKSVLALSTAQRNIAAALVIAGQSFDDPEVAVSVIVVALVGLPQLLLFSLFARRVQARYPQPRTGI